MSNTISLSDLHGVSLPKKDNEDEGCCIEERKEDNMKYDDVFVDDDSNLKSLNGVSIVLYFKTAISSLV